MNFIILDLEWSASFSRKRKNFVNEIIEFGAVKLNENLEITDEFSMLITPQIGKKLNSRIEELTSLTIEELNAAKNTFTHVLKSFSNFVDDDSVVMTWSNSDIIALTDNIAYYRNSKKIEFLQYYCNVQKYCEDKLNYHEKSKQLGLFSCCKMLGIENDESKHHRALEDARITAMCFTKLYDKESFEKYIYPANDEFYKRMAFRTYYILNMSTHLVHVGKLKFNCLQCGGLLERKSLWSLKNHSFRADFCCPVCNKKYLATVCYKAKYEGITVNSKVSELVVVKKECNKKEIDDIKQA